MQGHILARILLMSCFLAWLLPPAFANHGTGDFNQDGNTDLAVNVSGFDNIAILVANGQGDFALEHHIETDTLPEVWRAVTSTSMDTSRIGDWFA